MAFFARNTYCVITGASKGLGKEMAVQMSQEWAKEGAQCDLVLISRNMDGMQETSSTISSTAPGINTHMVQADLGKLDTIESIFVEAAAYADESKHQQFVLLHNAGTLGDISKPMIDEKDPQVVQDYLALNFTSVFVLTSLFLTRFKTGHRMIINNTSSLAFRFRPSFSLYTSGKAARNALMGVLAVENPDVRVFSYHPGATDTDILRSIPKDSYSEKTCGYFRAYFDEKRVSTTQVVIAKFVRVLREDEFENGAFVDFHTYS